MQHGDRLGDRPHELHVVLDDDDRVLAGERQQQLRRALGFLRRHAGDRLVDQQQLGLLHQQHADLEPLLLAVRQRAAPARARCGGQPDDLEHFVDALALSAASGARRSIFQNDLSPASASSRFSKTVRNSKTVGF